MSGAGRVKDTITPRDRVSMAIMRRETDRVPSGELLIEEDVISHVLNLPGAGFEEKAGFLNRLGLDIFCLAPACPDWDGSLPDAGDIGWPDIKRWTGETENFVFAILDGAFGWGFKAFGFEKFITLPLRSPKTLSALVAGVERLNTGLISLLAGLGINGIIIADDIAYQKGLLSGPPVMRKHFFPSLARQVSAASREGLPVFFHSDGNMNEAVSDLIEAGFTGLQCIEKGAGMDLLRLKREYGKSLCLWGGIDAGDLMPSPDPAQLENLYHAIAPALSGGGFILGTNSGIFNGMDIDSLQKIYSMARGHHSPT